MDDAKYIKIFRSEAEKYINDISQCLNTLQDDPKNKEAADIIMRRLHSMKGMASTMSYAPLTRLSHITEDFILSYVDKGLALDDQSLKLIYEVIGVVEKFNMSLPEVNNDLIVEMDKKIRKKMEGGDDETAPVNDKALDEKISSSVNDMLSSIDNNVKISVSTIDGLIADISELKHTESALKNLYEKTGSYKLKLIIRRFEKQLRKLSQSLIQLKMQPFDTIINQLERAISEYCLATGKKINFTANTNNIIIDSSVLKILVSPLIHLIRNAIDHGIESVEDREWLGKTGKGAVSLTVKKVHDFAEVTVKDDGKGIPIELVVEKAIKKGHIKERPDVLDSNFFLYILTRPGFTTKDEVSMVSGRGIGLDVVRSSLENIGGSVSLDTKKDKGTEIILKVPVTTAVIKSLLVKAAAETVAIPSSNIEKVLLIKREALLIKKDEAAIKYLHNGKTIDVKYLGSLLKRAPLDFDKNGWKDEYNILLMNMRNKMTAILVDDLISEEELFINPLTRPLKKMVSVLGYSILGSGTPVFMLDVNSL
jgi:two-component system chemotaxis sensor kinase CheA